MASRYRRGSRKCQTCGRTVDNAKPSDLVEFYVCPTCRILAPRDIMRGLDAHEAAAVREAATVEDRTPDEVIRERVMCWKRQARLLNRVLELRSAEDRRTA